MIKLQDLISENTQGYEIALARLRGDKVTEKKIVDILLKSMVYKREIESMVKKEMSRAKKDFAHEKLSSTDYAKRNEPKNINWNPAKYRKWIKNVASGGGKQHSYDMAQNAKHEPGLIQFIQKQITRWNGDETALERIQWDIEAS